MTLERVFLTALVAGVFTLVAALGVARWNGLPEVAPFSRATSVRAVLRHPEDYTRPAVARWVRVLAALGAALVLVAAAAVTAGVVAVLR